MFRDRFCPTFDCEFQNDADFFQNDFRPAFRPRLWLGLRRRSWIFRIQSSRVLRSSAAQTEKPEAETSGLDDATADFSGQGNNAVAIRRGKSGPRNKFRLNRVIESKSKWLT
jgi:hypothetical protein